MKKRILAVLIIICLALPLFAADAGRERNRNTIGVGLNLGTNTGLSLRYGYGRLDVISDIGLDLVHLAKGEWTIAFDIGATYQVYVIDGGENLRFPITLGLIATPSVTVGSNTTFNFGILLPVGIEYTFPSVPITMYFRLAPGMNLLPSPSIAFGASIGALWDFDLR